MIRPWNGSMLCKCTMLKLVATVMMFVVTLIVWTMGRAEMCGMHMFVTVLLGLMERCVRTILMSVQLIADVRMVRLALMALLLTRAIVLLDSLDFCKSFDNTVSWKLEFINVQGCHNLLYVVHYFCLMIRFFYCAEMSQTVFLPGLNYTVCLSELF